jgi:catechol 2,3-dioxygenase-like lactoylglutathione lyase family enzyme
MQPRITLITLAVDDLDRAVAFYRDGLGWKTDGIVGREIEHGAVCFFELHGGLKLGLWPRESLAFESGLPQGPRSATEFSLAHNVNSAQQVDAVLATVEAAGGTIVKAGHKTDWGGYTGSFQDTEWHLWEVAWNPAWGEQPE